MPVLDRQTLRALRLQWIDGHVRSREEVDFDKVRIAAKFAAPPDWAA